MIVVADTSVLNYLVLCDVSEVLPRLFGTVIIPKAVAQELTHRAAPAKVRDFAQSPPPWLLTQAPLILDPTLPRLGRGELEAISLAVEIHAELLLTDDKQARRVAESRGLCCSGTLGVVSRAADLGLLDFEIAYAQLRATTLRLPPRLER